MLRDETLDRTAKGFVLQWHLTHACDMNCAHCYDRTRLSVLRLEQAKAIVDDMYAFCEERGVRPVFTLSGGNPLFYAWFFELYEYIAQRECSISILGNPIPREQLERMIAIQKPRYYQVSLEGLEEHNDCIRGEGAYDRALAFLPLLRELGIRAIVMNTLTSDNLEQVVPLGEVLRGRADRMAFNRLSQVGNGQDLPLPDKETYGRFMIDYMVAQRGNPILGMKDNLFNIYRHELGMPLTGGCTGHGCGAAFNFFAVLPNGDAHACRKFPSKIGNVVESSFSEIWDSPEAARYRRGCTECDGCPIRAKCGGCLAVTSGHGLDPFTTKDPHCFMYD